MPKILPSIKKTILTKNFVSISKAAEFLKVSPDTLRNWEKEGKLLPSRTFGGARRYNRAELLELKKEIHPFAARKKGLVNISQAAKALRVSSDTLRNWDKKGLIETQRSKGGARRFTRDEIGRLQKELGVEERKLLLEAPKPSHKIHNFTSAWFRITFSMALLMLILAMGWFVESNIEPLQKKIDETSKLVAGTVKSIESLQKGVLGIQTQLEPSPLVLPGNLNTESANLKSTIVFGSAKIPLSLNSSDGQISCPDCLTVSSAYFSTITNSDGTLSLATADKTATIALNLDHSNAWLASQAFKGGIEIGTSSNPVVMTSSGNVGIGWTSPANKLEVAGAEVIGQGYAGNYTAPANGLLVQGNVGIGVSAPSYHLDVAGGARFGCAHAVDDPATSCSDIAEIYESDGSLDTGDIVTTGNQFNIVTKSKTPYQKNIIGVYSTSPGLLIGGQTVLGSGGNLDGNKIPVALTGRVPVKVSDENGSIQVGDFLTSSSIPGVAMKASKPGFVLGRALEPFDVSIEEVTSPEEVAHLVDIKLKMGRILAFVNATFADPGNFLASLTMDDQGNLIVPKIKTASITLDPSVAKLNNSSGSLDHQNDNISQARTTEDRLKGLESRVEKLTEKMQVETNGNVGIGTTVTPGAVMLDSTATPSALLRNDIIQFNLTPPDILLATSSAVMANIRISETLSSDKLFTAQDSKISGDLSVFGKTTLANTAIAGDLTVDGTFSLSGNSINVIGILYFQNSPLTFGVNFFNGLVTIDKLGNLRAQTVTVAEFRVVGGKISGSGKISEGSKSADLENPLVESSSRILITPTSETNLVLAVTGKTEGKSFTVSTAQPVAKDVLFDWFLINEVN